MMRALMFMRLAFKDLVHACVRTVAVSKAEPVNREVESIVHRSMRTSLYIQNNEHLALFLHHHHMNS